MNIKEIIKGIDKAESLNDLPAKYWPASHNEQYLFISYSHIDYKEVFKDLIFLNEAGINVWYDRSLTPSKNWELDAEQFMVNYHCIGVLFYLSKHSLASSSVYKEIKKAYQRKKPFIAIVISEKDESILDIYNSLPSDKKSLDKEEVLKEIFNENIIYINIHQDISQKIEKMNNLFKQQPLYNFIVSKKRAHSNDPDYVPLSEDYKKIVEDKYKFKVENDFAALISINNIDIVHADDLPEFVEIDNKYYPLAKIENCAFANCTKLSSIKIPSTMQLIKTGAFQNCQSLEEVILPEGLMILKSSAFAGCSSLTKVILPSTLKEIRCWAFAGCHSLKEIIIPKGVEIMEENVFDGLTDIVIYCESDKPGEKWHEFFNPDNAKVVWGYKRNNK